MLDHHNIPITIFSAGLHGELTCNDCRLDILVLEEILKVIPMCLRKKNVAK